MKTLQEIYNDFIAYFENKTGEKVTNLKKATIKVLAWSYSAPVRLLYSKVQQKYNDVFILTASEEGLKIIGQDLGLPRSGESDFSCQIEVTNNGTGTVIIPQETLFTNSTTGKNYKTITSSNISAGQQSVVNIEAVEAGLESNLTNGETLTLITPIADIDSTFTVLNVTDGADIESIESYRSRLIFAKRNPIQGGSVSDYYQWSIEPTEIINAYIYSPGPGIVSIYVESNSVDGVATQSNLDAVNNSINKISSNGYVRKPITDVLQINSITRNVVDVTITGLTPDTSNNRAYIENKLDEFLRTKEPYVEAIGKDKNDILIAGELSSEAFKASSEVSANITNFESFYLSSPLTTLTLNNGNKLKLGVITWQ